MASSNGVSGVRATANYRLSSWRSLEARDAQDYLDQEILTTERLMVVRCLYRPGYDVPAHYHPQEQITIVEEGALQLVVEGEPVEVQAGQMIVIPPRVRHATRVVGEAHARALNIFLLPEPTVVGGPHPTAPRMYR